MNVPIWLGFIIALGIILIDYHLYKILEELKRQKSS